MKRLYGFILLLALAFAGSAFAQQRWERNYGGTGDDYRAFVQQTQDTGYIVTGLTHSFGNGMQIYLIKTNALGDTLWTRNYGGTGDDEGVSVQQTQDGGYIALDIPLRSGTTTRFTSSRPPPPGIPSGPGTTGERASM